MSKKRIIPQMFDIRPVDETGDLDWGRIKMVEAAARGKTVLLSETEDEVLEKPFLEEERMEREKMKQRIKELEMELEKRAKLEKIEREREERMIFEAAEQERKEREKRIFAQQEEERKILEMEKLARKSELENIWKRISENAALQEMAERERQERIIFEAAQQEEERNILEKAQRRKSERIIIREEQKKSLVEKIRIANIGKRGGGKKGEFLTENETGFLSIFKNSKNNPFFELRRPTWAFACLAILILFGIGGVSFAYKGVGIKGKVLGVSQSGYESVSSAILEISNQNFEGSSQNFQEAVQFFSEASSEMDKMGTMLNEGSRFFPYVSKISSGKNMLEAGKHLSLAGGYANESMRNFSMLKKDIDTGNRDMSMLDVLTRARGSILLVKEELILAKENIDKVKVDDLPEEIRDEFLLLKGNLPKFIGLSETFVENNRLFLEILGANGPRKYLFLFQNNNEIRATGGFIGSYGLLDISNGRIKNFFIDGIFNPDGQLTDKIVPPKPIQKISAAWSLHDSNWFPDFPTSAKQAAIFYEKTGGPTVDGVIAITPVMMERLLEITGPIEMEEYGVILDSKNFIEKTQYEVERHNEEDMKDDKSSEENGRKDDPKKILSDLAPRVFEKVFNLGDYDMILKSIQVLTQGLKEKHVLIYSQNSEVQKMVSQRGWSGEIIDSKKDYLSVINTNINGYKTDGVVNEKISHKVEIRDDGSIFNKVSITRKHNGGNSEYEWWNKVNADYMRVYVPLGSRLLKVEGQTREVNESPLDYDKLGFERNSMVQREEENMIIDEETGTRIYEENGKTVFANWTYVSPQETMTITYEYELPFKIFPDIINKNDAIGSYSLLVQKQSGSRGSEFETEISFPDSYEVKWKFPQGSKEEGNVIKFSEKLSMDKFAAIVFEK